MLREKKTLIKKHKHKQITNKRNNNGWGEGDDAHWSALARGGAKTS
jgi:hypothetical protein